MSTTADMMLRLLAIVAVGGAFVFTVVATTYDREAVRQQVTRMCAPHGGADYAHVLRESGYGKTMRYTVHATCVDETKVVEPGAPT